MAAPSETVTEFRRLSNLLDQGLGELRKQVQVAAEAERDYRKAKARAWVEAPTSENRGEWAANQREAWVNAETADLRYARDVADGLKWAATEAVRSRRAQISYHQSLLAADRAEMEFSQTGPRYEP